MHLQLPSILARYQACHVTNKLRISSTNLWLATIKVSNLYLSEMKFLQYFDKILYKKMRTYFLDGLLLLPFLLFLLFFALQKQFH